MTAVAVPTTWTAAVEGLPNDVTRWAPSDFEVARGASRAGHPSLTLSHGERRIQVAPVEWKGFEIPVAADLFSNIGTRVRLFGPDAQTGAWEVYTADGINMRMPWTRAAFQNLLRDLL